jgi:hypothetical protein
MLASMTAEQREELERALEAEMLRQVTAGELSLEQLQAIERSGRPLRARNEFTARSFGDFYWCLFGKELPPRVKRDWVPELITAYYEHRGVLLDGHRGSTKSATILAWSLFVTAHKPFGSTVLVRINDDAAAESGAAMAAIIQHHPGWRACFPYIAADIEKGGSTGLFIKDTRIEQGNG